MKKFLTISLCILMAFGAFSGCATQPATYVADYDGLQPTSFEATETYLVKDSKSDYKIVIPEVSTNEERYVANELQYFVKQSTDCEIAIITDTGLNIDNSQKYLSIGNTTLLGSQTDIDLSYEELGELGPSVQTRGNTVYMAGFSDYGTVFAVYKFLHYQIGFKAYAYDCVTYDYYNDLLLLDFDYSFNPGIDYGMGSDGEVIGQAKADELLRMCGFSAGNGGYNLDGKLFNSLWCHTINQVVSTTYYPELYKYGQLCYSNPLSVEAAVETLCNLVATASGPFLMIGGLDNVGSCSCEECKANYTLYGGAGGVYMRFLNSCAEKVEEYCKEVGVEKEIVLVGLMYYAYAEPPVIQNEDGSLSPVDPSVIARNGQISVGICYTPIDACFMHPFGEGTCKTNETYSKHVKGWTVCAEKLFTYLYGTNFGAQKYIFNNWSFVGDTYDFLAENGYFFLTEEACGGGISPMANMRTFIRRELSWDPKQSTEALMNEFMDNYYGPGSAYVKKYFYSALENFERIALMKESECAGIYYDILSSKYWTREILLNHQSYLKTALYEIERSSLKDKDIYYERTYREYFLVTFQMYELHYKYFSAEELKALEQEIKVAQEKYNVYY